MTAPATLLLARYDAAGQLRLIARTLDRAPPVPDLLAGQGVAPAA
jgi:hypothetical protein